MSFELPALELPRWTRGLETVVVADELRLDVSQANVLQDEAYRLAVLDRTPLGRVGEAEEVARVAAFLAMPASSYVTGEVVAVDGGFLSYGFAGKV